MKRGLFYILFGFIISMGYSQSGTCLKFDGTDDYVAIEDMHYTTTHGITELTVCAWVLAFPGEGGWSIVDFDRSEYYNVEIGWHDQGTNVVNFATYSSSGGIDDMPGKTNVRDGHWHFITAVYDGTDKRIYVDGVLDATESNPHSGAGLGKGTTRYGFIGDGSEATSFNDKRNGFYYRGRIDEVSVWHRVLSGSEIQNIMNNEIANPTSEINLQAYYKFDDGSGQVLSNSASSNNNGQLGTTTGAEASDPSWENVNAAVADKMGSFNGIDQFDSINNTNDINTASKYNDRTVSVWFQASDITKNTKQVIFEEGGHINGLNIYIYNSEIYIGGWSEHNSWAGTYFKSAAISSGVWHHAALVLASGNTFTAYLDGVQIGTESSGVGPLAKHSGDICIARNGSTQFHDGDDNSVGSFFEGNIDELRIWNEARSLADIKAEMHRELLSPYSESYLVCNLRFNQSGGTFIDDYSSKNNDGQIGSNSWSDRTAPIPYFSVANGNWNADASWADGQKAPSRIWSRIELKHDITLTTDETCEELKINATASLTLNATKKLTVNGELKNLGGETALKIKASSAGPASLIHHSDGVEAQVETYLEQDAHYFISAPISDAVSNMYYDQYMYVWNEPNYTWDNFSETDVNLIPCKGYDVYCVSQDISTYSGTLNNGDQGVGGLTRKSSPASGEDPGFNLVGNPYPSVIDINGLTFPSGIAATSYVFRHSPKSYYFWSQGGTGDIEARYIQPGQGFFVEVTTTGATMSFTNAARTQTGLGSLDKNEEIINAETIIVSISKDGFTDKAYIAFRDEATAGFDNNFDASKLTGAYELPYVFSYLNNQLKDKLAINSFPTPDEDQVVPLGVRLPEEGNYSLIFSNFNSFYSAPEFYLKDNLLNKVYDLHKDSIVNFSYQKGQSEHRFDLYFKKIVANEYMDNHFGVYIEGDRIYVNSVAEYDDNSQVQIFNLLGQKVYENTLGNIQNGIPIKWESSYYLIQIQSGATKDTEKFFIP